MAHAHHHEDDGSYYMEQVCTIGISGLLGLVSVLLYLPDRTGFVRLNLLLAPKLHWTVLAGGIALLVLAVLQALALALILFRRRQVEAAHDHAHDHDHCHEHGHDHDHEHHHDHGHEHCDHDHDHEHAHVPALPDDHSGDDGHGPGHHDHDHGHDHGWAPWRYVVLLLPVILFFLNQPNQGFILGKEDVGDVKGGVGKVEDKGFDPELGYRELEGAAYSPERRALYEGRTVRLKGQFAGGGSDRLFSLVRFKMNCCAADAVPLSAVIMIDPDAKEHLNTPMMQGRWVEVTGQVQFRTRERNGREEWVTVIYVKPDPGQGKALTDLVKTIPPDPQPFL
jgi:hypothetical protein